MMSESIVKKGGNDLREMIASDDFKSQIALALPKHLTPSRFISVALTAMVKNPKLLDCTRESVIDSIVSLSIAGLEPDGRRAHLVPYYNKKRGVLECKYIIDYKGLVEMTINFGSASTVHSEIVCENDVFEYDKGEIKHHIIDYKKPRGKKYLVYVIFRMKDGGEKAEVMPLEDVENIRLRSPAGESGPWITDKDEMRKKTVTRRGSKWVPMSPQYRDVLEKDFDSFPELNQPSAKSMIPDPPLKKVSTPVIETKVEQKQELRLECEQEEPNPKVHPVEPGQTEPPNDAYEGVSPTVKHDEGTVDGLRDAIRDLAATHFPNENYFALWVKTLTTNEEKGYRGIDSIDQSKSYNQLKFIIGSLRREIAKKKEKQDDR